MITKEQFEKMKKKLNGKHCPICSYQITSFYQDNTDLFGSMLPYNEIDISNIEYIKVDCKHCGYTLQFKLNILLR